jgi:hypothetical protein
MVEVEGKVLGAEAEAQEEAEVQAMADQSIETIFPGQIAANPNIRQAQKSIGRQGMTPYPEHLRKPCG